MSEVSSSFQGFFDPLDSVPGSFSIPLTFLTVSGPRDRVNKANYISYDSSKSRSTVMTSYRFGEEGNRTRGLVGLEDGTVLLFRTVQKQQVKDYLKAPVHKARSPSPHASPSRASVRSLMTSRSPSPSGHSSNPFSVNMRSRIVSGITAEQVEAPKNYVDFDEEADKLKELLKGNAPRERRDSSVGRVTTERKSIIGDSEKGNSKRKETPKSLLSAPTSPKLSPSSLSTPSSPKWLATSSDTSGNLEMLSHVLLPHSGQGSSVTAIHVFGDLDVMAVLQVSG